MPNIRHTACVCVNMFTCVLSCVKMIQWTRKGWNERFWGGAWRCALLTRSLPSNYQSDWPVLKWTLFLSCAVSGWCCWTWTVSCPDPDQSLWEIASLTTLALLPVIENIKSMLLPLLLLQTPATINKAFQVLYSTQSLRTVVELKASTRCTFQNRNYLRQQVSSFLASSGVKLFGNTAACSALLAFMYSRRLHSTYSPYMCSDPVTVYTTLLLVITAACHLADNRKTIKNDYTVKTYYRMTLWVQCSDASNWFNTFSSYSVFAGWFNLKRIIARINFMLLFPSPERVTTI